MLLILLLPPLLALWYGYSINAVIVAEVVPIDRPIVPIPEPGDRVFIYGEWVRDEGHVFGDLYNWHEIHPLRYLKNRDSGEEGGRMPYTGTWGEGAWNAKWLPSVDPAHPLQNATGVVVETFDNKGDGDVHVHILPDPEYRYLVRFPDSPLRLDIVPLLRFYELNFEQSVLLVAGPPVLLFLLYGILSVQYPKETLLGRLVQSSSLEKLSRILSKGKLTKKDVEEHSKIVKEKVWKKHKKELGL